LFKGQPRDALPYIKKVLRRFPRNQNMFYVYYWLGHSYLLMHELDQAIDFFRKARAANPQLWHTHLLLAAALGLRGDIDEARSVLAESLKLKPGSNSIARLRAAALPYMCNPEFLALEEQTIFAGLRRAGLPEE
jgi:adenylate cyclase